MGAADDARQQDQRVYRASTTAPVNIAVIKSVGSFLPPPRTPRRCTDASQMTTRYWGKRDAALNLPTNSSLSVTLTQSALRAYTTASCSAAYPADDGLTLNGVPHTLSTPRTQACLAELRALRRELEAASPSLPRLAHLPLRIVSANNFPTAAGLASSAAGFAALVRAVANLYALPASPERLSRVARQGSGSACRSLLGGFVAWRAGAAADGSDSAAEQVAPAAHWPGVRAAVLVVSAAQKDVSSSAGMQATAATSSLFASRVRDVVPPRMAAMEAAVRGRDFAAFAELAMRDSNSFHATCADTWPPIFYMNDVSRAAVRACDAVNRARGRLCCAYTFDAGPNAVIFYQVEDEAYVLGALRAVLGDVDGWSAQALRYDAPQGFTLEARMADMLRRGVSRVILTAVGEGPINVEDHLVGEHGEILSAKT